MKFSKIIALSLALFFSSFSFIVNTSNAAASTEDHDGGPRDVVQTRTEVDIIQPTPTNLYITILDEDGAAEINEVSSSLETIIPTTDLEEGNYTIETVDDYGVFQEFSIEIES